MDIALIIPARYKSSRFPGKPLTLIAGKPMIIWVLEASSKAVVKENVFVATDDDRIFDLVQENGYKAIMTPQEALTGTDRLYFASMEIDADIYINVQGDEPLVDPRNIQKVIETKKLYPDEVICGMCELGENENPENVNIPKVVANSKNRLIYMSRAAIPGHKSDSNMPEKYWKQVCIYAFNKDELKVFGECKQKSQVEGYEDIEILRYFDLGVQVRMVPFVESSYAVDVKEDVATVEAEMKRRGM